LGWQLDTRLILIEGLPGSGKTGTARWLHQRLRDCGVPAEWCIEEDPEHSVLPRRVRRLASRPDFAERCLAAWERFSEGAALREEVHVLEGCAFQSSVRYLLEYGAGLDAIGTYVDRFEHAIAPLRPRLIYLYQADPARFFEEQTLARKGELWVAKVSAYLASTPYCRARGWNGSDGMLRFWLHYRSVCDTLQARLELPKLSIETSAQDRERVQRDIAEWLQPCEQPA
jgi:hypothetical protein